MPHVEQVIISEITRGDGRNDPFRPVTQVHKLTGEYIAEYDPVSSMDSVKENPAVQEPKRTRRATKQPELTTDPFKPIEDNRDDLAKVLDPVEQAQLALRNAG